jgi:putative hydrolase of the HAD superfamily
MTIQAMLFDADGVVVNPSFQFAKLLTEQYGITREMTRGFFGGVFNECNVGRAELKQVLPPYLEGWGWKGTVDEFVQLWLKTDHVIDMRIVNYISRLRRRGMLCCLATIQEANRAAYMRKEMGFTEVFDRLFFSCEVGYQKPELAYFHAVQQSLALEPQELLFWDDYLKNVDAARECGWQAELYITFEEFEERMPTWISR